MEVMECLSYLYSVQSEGSLWKWRGADNLSKGQIGKLIPV